MMERRAARLDPDEVRMLTRHCGPLVYPAGSPGAAWVRRLERAVNLMKGDE